MYFWRYNEMTDIIVFKNAFLIDGNGKDPKENATVVIKGNNIIDVGGGTDANIPNGAKIIDVAGKTLMPGMIDAHVHLTAVDDPTDINYRSFTGRIFSLLKTPSSLLVLYAAHNAKKMLDAGFTTIRDLLGGFTSWDATELISLRKAIELDLVPGPRIVVGGWVGATHGHGTIPFMEAAGSEMLNLDYPYADGEVEIRKRIRKLVRDGCDQLKTAISGSGFVGVESGPLLYTYNEMKAFCEEAHAAGKKAAVHAYPAKAVKIALEAGADTIEHGAYLDDETIQLFIEKNAILIPTLSVLTEFKGEDVSKYKEKMGLNVDWRLATEKKNLVIENFKKAYKAGVKIAMGTDIYFILMDYQGENAQELEVMVKYGMTPMDAIVASTKTAAEACGLEKEIGTIEEGKLADLIIVDGNPLKDIKILQDKKKILMVIKNGKIEVNRNGNLIEKDF